MKRWPILLLALSSLPLHTGRAELRCGPYLQNTQTNAITIMWETRTPSTATVTYAQAGVPKAFTQAVPDAPVTVMTNDSFWYAVTLTDLHPDTFYTYTVLVPGSAAESGTFRTFPMTDRPVTFIVIGDTHGRANTVKGWAQAFAQHQPDFVLHTGDLVDDCANLNQWRDGFFKAFGPLIRNVPIYPARGNHDGTPELLPRFFALPDDERNYSFDFGNAHFLCVDERGPTPQTSLQWAGKDLAASTSLWKIAWFHHPIFNVADHAYASKRDTYLPLFHRYGVDMTRSGHAHVYERFRPIAWLAPDDPRPVIHVVSGGGGGDQNRRGGLKDHPDIVANYATHHYTVVTIDGRTLTSTTYGRGNAVIDSFTVTKQANGLYDAATMTAAADHWTPVRR